MILLPAIDLKNGSVVRLFQGDFDTVHQVASDPAAVCADFLSSGARWLHMVDLDGAKDGTRKNGDIVRSLTGCGLNIELGGGLRTRKDLEEVFELGVSRAVIGSAAVSNPDLVREAVELWGDHVAVGVDTKNGIVRTAGWVDDSGLDYLTFSRSMEDLGVRTIIFTDIDTDGALTGPSFRRLGALQEAVSCRIVASGGVSCNEDIRRLAAMGLYGAIVGKAYYTGAVDLRKAVEDAGEQA